MTDMASSPTDLDLVFKTLVDPTRRAVIERLGIGPASTSDLARPFDMALPSFTQHLDMLEQAGIVTSIKNGRVRTYRLTPGALQRAGAWIGDQSDEWTRRANQLDVHLKTIKPLPKAKR
jgi:DNA-binding transcriptional ArsR family regulator